MTKRTRLVPATVAVVGALALAGCGGSDDEGTTATTPAPVTTPTSTAEESVSQDDTTDADAVFGTAIATAEGAVDGARAIGYDLDEGRVDVDLVVGTVEHEVELSADGSEVVSQEQNESLDSAEAELVEQAAVPITDAVSTALAQDPGTVEAVELERDGDTVRWKIDVSTGGSLIELYVDATTGELVP